MMREMVIFAKKRTNTDGKSFYTYLTKMTCKNGEEIVCCVKFREECGAPDPKECPCVIEVENSDCNYSPKRYIDEASGMNMESHILWVKKWKPGGDYIDTSMEKFV